jgi:hypothetical protein
VFITLDGCLVNQEALQFFSLLLSHCFRAIPLAWPVMPEPSLITMEKCEALLDEAAQLLQRVARVTFLADRGFRDKNWARKCLKLGWNYGIRSAISVRSYSATAPRHRRTGAPRRGTPGN